MKYSLKPELPLVADLDGLRNLLKPTYTLLSNRPSCEGCYRVLVLIRTVIAENESTLLPDGAKLPLLLASRKY